jgi:hypothetical protein
MLFWGFHEVRKNKVNYRKDIKIEVMEKIGVMEET